MKKLLMLVILYMTNITLYAQSDKHFIDSTCFLSLQAKLNSFEANGDLNLITSIGRIPCIFLTFQKDMTNRQYNPINNYRNFDVQKIYMAMYLISRIQKYPNFQYDLLLNYVKITKYCKENECEFQRKEFEKQEILQNTYSNFIEVLVSFFFNSNNFTPQDIDTYVLKDLGQYFSTDKDKEIFRNNLSYELDRNFSTSQEKERVEIKTKLNLSTEMQKESSIREIWKAN